MDTLWTQEKILESGRKFFGLTNFKDGQYPLIKAILEGKDVLGILPTGGGKSICYQLPALMSDQCSIVISPLKSLMKDQVHHLTMRGICHTDFIDSTKSAKEKEKILQKIESRQVKLLYLSPERLQMRSFRRDLKDALKDWGLHYLIVDEAHCISEWGHDFRPSYLQLYEGARELEVRQVVAVTATAPPKVRKDIIESLGIPEEHIITSGSLNRKELSFHVCNVPRSINKERAMLSIMDQLEQIVPGGPGLVFTIYAQPEGDFGAPFGTRFLQEFLKEQGREVPIYHGKLADEERMTVQERFVKGEEDLLIATKGFGMGIDKGDVRYVLHTCYPPSLEAYYQEAGRGGRDGKNSYVVLMVRPRLIECRNQCPTQKLEDPPCTTDWSCSFTQDEKCDYGMQAKFIAGCFPNEGLLRKEVHDFLIHLKNEMKESRDHCFLWKEGKAVENQLYLHLLKTHGFIQGYALEQYEQEEQRFSICVHDGFWYHERQKEATEILVNHLLKVKRERYASLEEMDRYAKDVECRKQRLMDHFQDGTLFGHEGCGSCDLDGSVFFSLEGVEMIEESEMVVDSPKTNHPWHTQRDFWMLSILTVWLLWLWMVT